MTYTYTISTAQMTLFILLLLWELVWTSLGLWRAARRNQPYWFAAMLIVNSAGVLPIIYLIMTRSKKDSESRQLLNASMSSKG